VRAFAQKYIAATAPGGSADLEDFRITPAKRREPSGDAKAAPAEDPLLTIHHRPFVIPATIDEAFESDAETAPLTQPLPQSELAARGKGHALYRWAANGDAGGGCAYDVLVNARRGGGLRLELREDDVPSDAPSHGEELFLELLSALEAEVGDEEVRSCGGQCAEVFDQPRTGVCSN
jgi:hypothetical protein